MGRSGLSYESRSATRLESFWAVAFPTNLFYQTTIRIDYEDGGHCLYLVRSRDIAGVHHDGKIPASGLHEFFHGGLGVTYRQDQQSCSL